MVALTPRAVLARRKREPARVSMAAAQKREYVICSPIYKLAGFRRFCERHVWIPDKMTGQPIPFNWFRGQERINPALTDGLWMIILKGRQLGITTDIQAYALWRAVYHLWFETIIVSSQAIYAKDMVRGIKGMYDRLPLWMRPRLTTDTLEELRFEAEGKKCSILALVGSARTGRSLTGDLTIVDEASRVEGLEEALPAVIPQLEVSGGQLVLLSTSAGPTKAFYDVWDASYGQEGDAVGPDGMGPVGFMPIFIHWSERPGRDGRWYEQQAVALGGGIHVKREYPNTPEEAFDYATGRIYPMFTRAHSVGDIEIPRDATRYRAIDWGGGASAHVVLWAVHIPGKPGLLVSPDCPETIRELLGYRWDEKQPDKPVKHDDHSADALRYLVTSCAGGLSGLVYVYREVYRPNSISDGWTPMKYLEEVHKLSGWVEAPPEVEDMWQPGRQAEFFEETVADRSNTLMIAHFNQYGIPTQPHRKFRAATGTDGQTDRDELEVLEGIRYVSMLIDGSIDIDKRVVVDRSRALVNSYRAAQRRHGLGVRASVSLEETAANTEGRQIARRSEARQKE